MGLLTNHPHTSVTTIINDCCSQADASSTDDYDYYIDAQLDSLIKAIAKQKDFIEPGPVEAARAIRKKLKYGNLKEQLNSIKVLNSLILNCNPKLLNGLLNDVKLQDRLQFILISNDQSINSKVFNYTYTFLEKWYNEFNDDANFDSLFLVYERCLKNKGFKNRLRKISERQVPDFMNDEADMDTPFDDYEEISSRPKTNAELDKKFRIPKINYEKEAPKIMQLIAEANILSTNLINILNSLEKDELAIHNIKANDSFDNCRSIRRKVLRYLQLVQREELLGPLLKCNDDLVDALKKYEMKSESSGGMSIPTDSSDESSDEESWIPPSTPRRAPSITSDNQASDEYDDVEEELPDPIFAKRSPPPVPKKKTVLRASKPVQQHKTYESAYGRSNNRSNNREYDPFSDDNEVAPASWA